MIHLRLLKQLDLVARRFRQVRLWRNLAIVWLLAALVALGLWIANSPADASARVQALALCGIAGVLAVLAGLAAWRSAG
jgi:ethanolamine transporter EutH